MASEEEETPQALLTLNSLPSASQALQSGSFSGYVCLCSPNKDYHCQGVEWPVFEVRCLYDTLHFNQEPQTLIITPKYVPFLAFEKYFLNIPKISF